MLKSARGRGVLAYKSTLLEQKWVRIDLWLHEEDNFFLECLYLNKEVTCEEYELFSVSFWARPLSLVLNLS